jgi:hypothetical protein
MRALTAGTALHSRTTRTHPRAHPFRIMPSGSDTEAISTDNERDSDGDDNPQHAKGRAQPMPRAAVATRPNVNAPRVRAAKRGCARCARHVLQRTAARTQARERLTAAVAKVRAESKARFAKARQKTRTCVAEAKHRARADTLALIAHTHTHTHTHTHIHTYTRPSSGPAKRPTAPKA